MLIDWFTVGAQALNFIVLVWLMKRFLYRPVIDAIDAREKRIAMQLADADTKKSAAQNDRDELQHKHAVFDERRTALLNQASDDAKAQGQKMLDAARQAAEALAATRRDTMASDANTLKLALQRRTLAEVFAIARQTLTDVASSGLEASACAVFIVRLQALEGTARDDLGRALKSSNQGAVVRSAFELPAAQRMALSKAVDDAFAVEMNLRYETAPELVSGIELSAGGHKFAWSIGDYLASLERGVSDLLKPVAPPVRAPAEPAAKLLPAAQPAPVPLPT